MVRLYAGHDLNHLMQLDQLVGVPSHTGEHRASA
jgi:hypothetical protein